MSNLQVGAARKMLKAFLNKTTYSLSLEIALFSGNNELAGNGYVRKSIPRSIWNWSGFSLYNKSSIQWQATQDWPNVTSAKIINSVDQEVVFSFAFSPAIEMLSPNVLKIPVGYLSLSREPTSNWTDQMFYYAFLEPIASADGYHAEGNPRSYWFRLFTSPPDMTGWYYSGTECSGSGYSSVEYSGGWNDTATGIANASDIIFPVPSDNDWNFINSVVLTRFDGWTYVMAVANVTPIDPGNAQIVIAAGSLKFDI